METFNINDFTNDFPGFLDSLEGSVDWNNKDLVKITRLRLLSDPGHPVWDVSYCFGQLRDGTNVRVDLPFYQLPKRNVIGTILKYAKRDGVYAKGLGIFDNISRFC